MMKRSRARPFGGAPGRPVLFLVGTGRFVLPPRPEPQKKANK